jgi:hypothetical protein
MWFGLLFFAGITSSLAMGQPVMAFFEDEYGVTRRRAAALFGGLVLFLGFLCVWLYPGGTFDEFDFWSGTFSLVVFALCEAFVFAYVFGMDKGWEEITRGADIRVPPIFRFVIKYITPFFILIIFVAALIKPAGSWGAAFAALFGGQGWPLAPDSVFGKVLHVGVTDYVWFDAQGRVTRPFIEDMTRILLMLLFVTCGFLVWRAWQRKRRNPA